MKYRLINWLMPYYLMPNHPLFKGLSFLAYYLKAVIFTLCFAIPLLPIGYWVNSYVEGQQLAQQLAEIEAQTVQQSQLYQAMKNRQQQRDNQHNELAAISQQVEVHLKQQQVIIERLQWHTEEGKTLTLVAQKQAAPLFRAVENLGALKALKAKNVLFTKQHQQRQVQLIMTFLLNHEESTP